MKRANLEQEHANTTQHQSLLSQLSSGSLAWVLFVVFCTDAMWNLARGTIALTHFTIHANQM